MLTELEEQSFHAWPAAEVRQLGGWRLRFTGSVSRRANSVWPNAFDASVPLDTCIAEVEAFYAARGLPARYQMSAAAAPSDLDATLAARGYLSESPTAVEVAGAAHVASQANSCIRTVVEDHASPEWFQLSASSRFSDSRQEYEALLERLSGQALFALAEHDGSAASVGLGVLANDWLGVFSLYTPSALRNRGLGAAVVAALAAAAAQRGVQRLYLQVDAGNAAARSLYRRLGFVEVYQYFYRSRGL